MAESVVSFLANRLGNLGIEEAKFLHGVEEQIRLMETELKFLQSLLRDADRRQDEDETLRTWISEIREAAYDAEDVINTFLLEVAYRRGGSGILSVLKRYSCIFKECNQLHKVGSEIESIKANLFNLRVKLQNHGITRQSQEEGSSSTSTSQPQLRRTYSHYEEDVVVGFEKDIKILVAELVNEGKNSPVVSICGMGGLGKTTLAKKVYHHSDVRRHFDGFAWVFISQQYKTRDVWKGLLIKLTSPSLEQRKEISELRDEELARKLYQVQQEKKYLVVLDDIWSTEAWDGLRPAFPLGDAGSKILLTSRNKDVALHVNQRGLHALSLLDEKESWELFKKKAFPKEDDPDEQESWELFQKKALPREDDPGFVEVRREIVKRCGGLPLAIVVLGGLLAKKDLTQWKWVLKDVESYSRIGKGHDSVVQKVLALSYHDLPYQLKPCFLYLSHFPEDFNIPAKKLTQMWVAEGFVSTMQNEVQGEENLVEIAEGYLHELIDRCMVQVGQVSIASGRIKTCRLHDLMRDLSISIAKEENFFKYIERIKSSSMVSSSRVHRLADFGNHKDNIKSILPSKHSHLRSLLLRGKKTIKEKHLRTMFNTFRLLRVFSFEGITAHERLKSLCCSEIGEEMLSLKLPSSIVNLGCLQFLNLQCVDGSQLVIPNVIWKMELLRHVYFPLPYSWTSTGKLRMGNLRNLQTLVNFRIDKCDIKDLFKLTNLRKLSLFSEDQPSSKKFVEMLELPRVPLDKLWSLSLIDENGWGHTFEQIDGGRIVSSCPHLYKLYVKGRLEKLPSYEQFPSNITKLVLECSLLQEDPMPAFEKLPNLKILYLINWAFHGPEMVCSKEGFRQLKSLLFYRLINLKEWGVEEGAMPSLHRLEISYCWRLKNVLDGLRFITTLRELEIRGMTAEFNQRLKEGGEDFDKIKHVSSVSIY